MEHLRFKHPFTCLVSGPTGCGKTELVLRILKHKNNLIDKPVSKILWCFNEIETCHNSTKQYILFNGIPNYKQLHDLKPDLVIIDDQMEQVKNNPDILTIFTKLSHHLTFSVFLIVQNLFFNTPNLRTISLNCHYLIIMKNPRDKTQIGHIAKQMFPEDYKYFVDSFINSTRRPHSYLRCDFTPSTPDEYRLSSRLTPEEFDNQNISPILYMPTK